jgi:exonuclease III
MKVTIITQNLQGINNPSKVDIVSQYFQPLLSSVDVLCFQEHRLRGEGLAALKTKIWPRATFFGREATVGYRHGPGDVGASRGGVCLWVAPQISHLVLASGQSHCNRAQWIRLHGTPGGDIAILNIYASTEVRERIDLWGELLTSLPRGCRWFLAGDWNVVERKVDKSSSCGKIMSDEGLLFQQLKLALKVEDTFPNSSPIKFSWDNKRRDGVRILARLDRIYSFQPVTAEAAPMAEYYIRGDSNHFDHLPVVGKFLLQVEARRKSSYAMNAGYLGDEAVKAGVHRIWSSHPNLGFTCKLRRVVKF